MAPSTNMYRSFETSAASSPSGAAPPSSSSRSVGAKQWISDPNKSALQRKTMTFTNKPGALQSAGTNNGNNPQSGTPSAIPSAKPTSPKKISVVSAHSSAQRRLQMGLQRLSPSNAKASPTYANRPPERELPLSPASGTSSTSTPQAGTHAKSKGLLLSATGPAKTGRDGGVVEAALHKLRGSYEVTDDSSLKRKKKKKGNGNLARTHSPTVNTHTFRRSDDAAAAAATVSASSPKKWGKSTHELQRQNDTPVSVAAAAAPSTAEGQGGRAGSASGGEGSVAVSDPSVHMDNILSPSLTSFEGSFDLKGNPSDLYFSFDGYSAGSTYSADDSIIRRVEEEIAAARHAAATAKSRIEEPAGSEEDPASSSSDSSTSSSSSSSSSSSPTPSLSSGSRQYSPAVAASPTSSSNSAPEANAAAQSSGKGTLTTEINRRLSGQGTTNSEEDMHDILNTGTEEEGVKKSAKNSDKERRRRRDDPERKVNQQEEPIFSDEEWQESQTTDYPQGKATPLKEVEEEKKDTEADNERKVFSDASPVESRRSWVKRSSSTAPMTQKLEESSETHGNRAGKSLPWQRRSASDVSTSSAPKDDTTIDRGSVFSGISASPSSKEGSKDPKSPSGGNVTAFKEKFSGPRNFGATDKRNSSNTSFMSPPRSARSPAPDDAATTPGRKESPAKERFKVPQVSRAVSDSPFKEMMTTPPRNATSRTNSPLTSPRTVGAANAHTPPRSCGNSPATKVHVPPNKTKNTAAAWEQRVSQARNSKQEHQTNSKAMTPSPQRSGGTVSALVKETEKKLPFKTSPAPHGGHDAGKSAKWTPKSPSPKWSPPPASPKWSPVSPPRVPSTARPSPWDNSNNTGNTKSSALKDPRTGERWSVESSLSKESSAAERAAVPSAVVERERDVKSSPSKDSTIAEKSVKLSPSKESTGTEKGIFRVASSKDSTTSKDSTGVANSALRSSAIVPTPVSDKSVKSTQSKHVKKSQSHQDLAVAEKVATKSAVKSSISFDFSSQNASKERQLPVASKDSTAIKPAPSKYHTKTETGKAEVNQPAGGGEEESAMPTSGKLQTASDGMAALEQQNEQQNLATDPSPTDEDDCADSREGNLSTGVKIREGASGHEKSRAKIPTTPASDTKRKSPRVRANNDGFETREPEDIPLTRNALISAQTSVHAQDSRTADTRDSVSVNSTPTISTASSDKNNSKNPEIGHRPLAPQALASSASEVERKAGASILSQGVTPTVVPLSMSETEIAAVVVSAEQKQGDLAPVTTEKFEQADAANPRLQEKPGQEGVPRVIATEEEAGLEIAFDPHSVGHRMHANRQDKGRGLAESSVDLRTKDSLSDSQVRNGPDDESTTISTPAGSVSHERRDNTPASRGNLAKQGEPGRRTPSHSDCRDASSPTSEQGTRAKEILDTLKECRESFSSAFSNRLRPGDELSPRSLSPAGKNSMTEPEVVVQHVGVSLAEIANVSRSDSSLQLTEKPNKMKSLVHKLDNGSSRPKIKADGSEVEESPSTTGKDVSSVSSSKSRRIRFRDPFPILKPAGPPRDNDAIVAENLVPMPDLPVRWVKPKTELKHLIVAAMGPSLQRRSNACGALKVLTGQKKNQLTLVRTDSFLAALIYAATQDIPNDEKDLAVDARTRAVSCIRNVCTPKDNRPLVLTHPGMTECLLKVIADDSGEGRALACASVAMLAKSAVCREAMMHVEGLVDMMPLVLTGSIAKDGDDDDDDDDEQQPVSRDDAANDCSGSEASRSTHTSADGDHDSDDDESLSSATSTDTAEGPERKNEHTDKDAMRLDSIRRRNGGLQDEYLQQARSNICAALLHLSKQCSCSPALCARTDVLRSVVSVAREVYNPIHSKCLEIICNLTCLPGNNAYLTKFEGVVGTLVAAASSTIPENRILSLRSLQNMSSDASSREVLASPEVLNLLTSCAMRKDEEEREASVSTLYNITTEPSAVVAITNTKNVVATLVHLAHTPESSSNVRLLACEALATVSLWLQTLAGAGKVPDGVVNVPLPTQKTTGWERWD